MAPELFGDKLISGYDWPTDRSILDGFPERLSIKDVVASLTAVGFGSPPARMRPFHMLSNDEQFRVTVARALAEATDFVVIAEFTSVVDRQVAKVASHGVQKAVRRSKKPRLPNDALLALIDGRASFQEGTLERIRVQLVQQVRLTAAAAADDAEALRRAGATVEESRTRLMVGIASGDGTRSIAHRLRAPKEGEFVRLAYHDALLATRLGINDAFNEGHTATLRQAKETLPQLGQVWVSAKVRSTPICLGLHRQIRDIGEDFSWRGWHSKRPPAVGQGAAPSFHLCRSRLAPHHPDWSENPKLAPLSSDEIGHFLSGDGAREKDVARRKVYPGFSPRADRP